MYKYCYSNKGAIYAKGLLAESIQLNLIFYRFKHIKLMISFYRTGSCMIVKHFLPVSTFHFMNNSHQILEKISYRAKENDNIVVEKKDRKVC